MKFLSNLVLVLVIIFNIFLIVKGIAVKKYYKKEIITCVKRNEESNRLFIRDLDLLSQEVTIDSKQINFDIRQQAVTHLIYTYAGDECNKCTIEDITLLKEKISEYQDTDVFVLPVFENTRSNNIGLKADLEGINYKRLDKANIKFPHRKDGSSVRFFAILHPTGEICLPFFPEAAYPERTKLYLDFIFSRVLSNCQDSEAYTENQ